MAIEKWSDDIWLIKLENEPALSEDLVQARDKTQREANMPSLVLDLSAVTRLNSSNLSQMLRLRKEAIDRDSKLRLAGLSDPIWAVFLTTGLDKVFEFAEDIPTALAGLQIEG